ncbi:unnamed protein product [Arctogadus glacialis]
MKQGEVAASWYTGRCEGLQVVQGRGEPDECWLAAWRKGGQPLFTEPQRPDRDQEPMRTVVLPPYFKRSW